MAKTIIFGEDEKYLQEAVDTFCRSVYPVALTGAGISVESGIPDFRSPGGLWTLFAPEEYATIDVFLSNPEKAWRLYRAMYETIVGKKPNDAHYALARMEKMGLLKYVITQNIDGLHERAGSANVISIHGDSMGLRCIHCNIRIEIEPSHFTGSIPLCHQCRSPLKPDYVLFGEQVRHMSKVEEILSYCDAMLIIGTSGQVYPAAGFPSIVKRKGGRVFEFNIAEQSENVGLITMLLGGVSSSDYYFKGNASLTVSLFTERVLRGKKGE